MTAPLVDLDFARPLGQGRYAALFVWLHLPNRQVDALLPPAFSRAACPFSPGGSHPLVLSIGRQSGVGPAHWPGKGWAYNEAILTLPWLHHQGQLCTWPMRLWLDRRRPVWLGRPYGFPKQRSPLQVSQGQAEVPGVFSVQHQPIHGEARTRLRRAGVLAGLGQPLVANASGHPVRSWMDWQLQDAELTSAAVQLKSALPWLPNLVLGEDSPQGLAWFMTHSWTLTAPERL